MVARVQTRRTLTADLAPTGLLEGELSAELASNPIKLWIGVPTAIDPTGRKLLLPSGGVSVAETPPVAPKQGDLWYESDTGVFWLWYDDGTSAQWVQVNGSPGGGAGVTIADAAPATPKQGDLWWESDSGILWVWYEDGTSNQWVQAAGSGGGGGTGEPPITPGLITDYWRGDKTWQELNHIASLTNDMSARFSGTTFVINDKADGTGTNTIFLSDSGGITAEATIRCREYCDVRATAAGAAKFSFSTADSLATPAALEYVYASQVLTLRQSPTGYSNFYGNGNIDISGTNAVKITAGDWLAASDARIKNVTGDYTQGLAAILEINPRTFTFRNNVAMMAGDEPLHRSFTGQEFIGIIAQEAEVAMPELTTNVSAYIDGQQVSDLRMLDTTALTYALINAVKELSAEIDALKAQLAGAR